MFALFWIKFTYLCLRQVYASFPLIFFPHLTSLGSFIVKKKTNWHQFLSSCPLIDDKFRHNIVKVYCGTTRRSHFDSIRKNINPSMLSDVKRQESLKRNWLAVNQHIKIPNWSNRPIRSLRGYVISMEFWGFCLTRAEDRIKRTKEPWRGESVLQTNLQCSGTHIQLHCTLNYPPERSSLPVHPRKSCGLSSAVQAAAEGNLVDSVTRVTDDRTRPARHPRLSPRWRFCHVNPTWEQLNTSQYIADEEINKGLHSSLSFLRL